MPISLRPRDNEKGEETSRCFLPAIAQHKHAHAKVARDKVQNSEFQGPEAHCQLPTAAPDGRVPFSWLPLRRPQSATPRASVGAQRPPSVAATPEAPHLPVEAGPRPSVAQRWGGNRQRTNGQSRVPVGRLSPAQVTVRSPSIGPPAT